MAIQQLIRKSWDDSLMELNRLLRTMQGRLEKLEQTRESISEGGNVVVRQVEQGQTVGEVDETLDWLL